ncbi:unnamed protein product [Onchocerca flexuosa]|uniref:Ovule protein n=1 Tax=Onchocerca flexuosa TaxID=387005 RepID=A0A183HA33_9BILA|nr:unnamed protein product [Onchocerca flexuosa]
MAGWTNGGITFDRMMLNSLHVGCQFSQSNQRHIIVTNEKMSIFLENIILIRRKGREKSEVNLCEINVHETNGDTKRWGKEDRR